jgi:mannosyltransferase OCH1-like enzyme
MLNTKRAQGLLKNHFVNPPTNLSIDWNRPKTVASAFNVPKIIHYIWVGEKRIPDSALRNIYRMHQTNCSQKSLNSFKITLWTDNPKRILDSMYNAEKSDDLILRQLAINSNKDSKIRVEHYSELFKDSRNQNIANHKIKLYLEGLVTRNLYGPFRNYACASDILRLFAVNLGGIYLDVDVAVIDKIPESCLTSEHGIGVYYKNGKLSNNIMIAAPNDWNIKNLLMFICEQHATYNKTYSDQYYSTDKQLNITWHQQRSLQKYINSSGKEVNMRKNLTMGLTGPLSYRKAYTCIHFNYKQACLGNYETILETARNYLIESGNIERLRSSSKIDLYFLGYDLMLERAPKLIEFCCSKYWITSDVFYSYEDPKEYSKPVDINNLLESPEENKPFFTHGVVYGIAPNGDMEDKLDSWCEVDTNTKHHDTSDIPCV